MALTSIKDTNERIFLKKRPPEKSFLAFTSKDSLLLVKQRILRSLYNETYVFKMWLETTQIKQVRIVLKNS